MSKKQIQKKKVEPAVKSQDAAKKKQGPKKSARRGKDGDVCLSKYLRTFKAIVEQPEPGPVTSMNDSNAVIISMAKYFSCMVQELSYASILGDPDMASDIDDAVAHIMSRKASLRKLVRDKVVSRNVSDMISAHAKLAHVSVEIENRDLLVPKLALLCFMISRLEESIPSVKTIEDAQVLWADFIENAQSVANSIFALGFTPYTVYSCFPESDFRAIRLLDKLKSVISERIILSKGPCIFNPGFNNPEEDECCDCCKDETKDKCTCSCDKPKKSTKTKKVKK